MSGSVWCVVISTQSKCGRIDELGIFQWKALPKPRFLLCLQVSDRDDRLLTEQMLDLERKNQEVAGDDDSEEEEVGMGDVDVENPAIVA